MNSVYISMFENPFAAERYMQPTAGNAVSYFRLGHFIYCKCKGYICTVDVMTPVSYHSH